MVIDVVGVPIDKIQIGHPDDLWFFKGFSTEPNDSKFNGAFSQLSLSLTTVNTQDVVLISR